MIRSKLADDIQESIRNLEEATKDNTGLKFTIAINYGSRDEIRRGITDIAKKVKAGEIEPEDITEDMISASLDTEGMPDPDLLIRTSGGTENIKLSPLADCVFRVLFYSCMLA